MSCSMLRLTLFVSLLAFACQSSPPDNHRVSAAGIELPSKEDQSLRENNENSPTIAFADRSFDFGEIFHAEKVSHEFKFVNEGNGDLQIKGAKASCGCTKPSYPTSPIAPGENGMISVTYNSVGKQGFQRATIRVTSNDPKNPEVVLKLKGRVKVKPKAEYEAEQAARKKSSG